MSARRWRVNGAVPVLTRRRTTWILIVAARRGPAAARDGCRADLCAGRAELLGRGGAGDTPSQVARRDIPANFLRIYEQVGARYKIPWEILAGIGKEECDHGRFPAPSCTPIPGARGPGVANFAGASGPMAIGVGGAAGDAYDALRHYLPNPALGPHDPTTAVELAALVLIKDKGAPTGRPIDAYWRYAEAYNGSGPAAGAYADRVIADAHAYQGAGHQRRSRSPGASPLPAATSTRSTARRGRRRATTMGVDYDPLKVEPVQRDRRGHDRRHRLVGDLRAVV